MARMKIVILCDGTWKTEVDKEKTNVAKLGMALAEANAEDQLVYYDRGVGTVAVHSDEGNFLKRIHQILADKIEKIVGGLTGEGLNKNIKQAYKYLVQHYKPGDEIYLQGFSRGAYTVRSLAGMIRKVGILKSGANVTDEEIDRAFELYRDGQHPDQNGPTGFRSNNSHGNGKIKFLGVYDTVGSLGIPDDIINDSYKYAFHDTKLGKHIQTARHALAIDEHREDFLPTLWDPGHPDSEQRWFIGAHSDVGGGYEDCRLADIARAWMEDEMRKVGLSIPPFELRSDCALGKLHDSSYQCCCLPFWKVRSSAVRVLGCPYSDQGVDPSVIQRFKRMSYRPKNILCNSVQSSENLPQGLFLREKTNVTEKSRLVAQQ